VTIPASTVKTVKGRLYDAILATVTAEGVNDLGVFYDEPGPNKPNDIVAVGTVRRLVQPLGVVGDQGAGRYLESYTVDVDISIFRTDARAAFERMCDIVDIVIAAQRSDPTFGGALYDSSPGEQELGASTWDDEHKGVIADTTVRIVCSAAI
jgi:hypothetical protein